MNATHRVIINTGILYARMAITVFLSLYTTRVILDALGAGDFGIFVVVGGAIAMLTFLNAGMAAATQRFMSFAQGRGDQGRQRSIFNVSVVLHALVALVVLGILEGAGFILFNGVLQIEPERTHAAWIVYQCAIISTIFAIISVPYDAVINAREDMLVFAVLSVIEALLKLAIALYIADVDGDQLAIYGGLMATLPILLLLLRVAYCHRRYDECELSPYRQFNFPIFKEMMAFSGWSSLGSSSSIVANYGQGVVLNIFFGTAVNAAQGVASQVSGQLGTFGATMLRALNPLIAKSEGAGNRELMLKASMIGSKLSFFMLMLFYVPILVEMPYILDAWLANVPEYTAIFCTLLLVRNLVEQLFTTLPSSIAAVGDIRSYQIATSVLTLLPLPISFFLFQAGLPPYALYLTFLIYSIATSSVILYYAKQKCGLNRLLYLRDVVFRGISAFLLTLLISASPLLFLDSGLIRLSVVGTVSFGAFLVSVWWIGFCDSEREYVKHLLRAILKRIAPKICFQ